MMISEANSRVEPALQAEIRLSDSVESLLSKIYSEQKLDPILPKTRRRLAAVSEDFASECLLKIISNPVKHTLDGFVCWLLNRDPDQSPRRYGGSPVLSPSSTPGTPLRNRSPASRALSFQGTLDDWVTQSSQPAIVRHIVSPIAMANSTTESPQLKALGGLEFRKAFLILNYIGSHRLEEVIAADQISGLADLTMQSFELEVWNILGKHYAKQEDRRRYLDWDYGKTHYYHCHVSPDGSYKFKGPFLENTTTHLHRVLGDENVMIVKFADIADKYCSSFSGANRYSTSGYKSIAERGIMVGLRLYRFFVFKDGGRDEKKKDPMSKGVKCYFVRTESKASVDMGKHYILSGKTINEARMRFMHVHTLPSLASYMARFSLILSKTKKLDIDLSDINFERIEDINCQDEDGNNVYDCNGKPCIHSDGTGFVSEDIAWKCPINVYKGKHMKGDRIGGDISELATLESRGQEPPLLIQFRMFYNGCAVKGTFLLNKKLPPRTVQVRPSMIKVDNDPSLSNFRTENSLEVVCTSNQPKRAKLSKNLIALLSYGKVPNEFFLDILYNTLEEAKDVFCNTRAALKAALNYGDMDDLNAARMILSGIPLDEPFLQHHLSILSKTERNDLKAGKLPITDSYYLMGTVDPTGELEKDEVCVILESGHLSGEVLVYRNPGLHFGDVHILKARYVEALHEIVGNAKYGIFFPQKGPRSLADEIAGGDFDGDMYFISRNPELLKHYKGSEPWVSSSTPNNETHRKPSDYSAEELEDQLFDLFLRTRFHPSKTTGMAADSWLAIMDRLLVLGDDRPEEKNQMKKNMLRLIDKYYDALDAPKKGAKVELPFELRAESFPHYMERERSFKSTSVLGLIYDMVKSYQIEDVAKPDPRKLSCFEDVVVPDSLIEKWRNCYNSYKAEMSRAMQLASGDKKDAANEITQRYKQEFYGAPDLEQSSKRLDELYLEALAVYHVVYDYAMNLRSVEKCGFAWRVAGAVLCRMYVERQEERPVLCSSAVLKEVLG